jgi:hypothetical protein
MRVIIALSVCSSGQDPPKVEADQIWLCRVKETSARRASFSKRTEA